jgi:hypothetical protein
MRPTCGKRLGRGGGLEDTATAEGVASADAFACCGSSKATAAGANPGAASSCAAGCVTGDEGGERSKIVPACECLGEDSSTGCTSVLTVRLAYRCGGWSDRRTTLGEAGRAGGAKAGKTGLGGRSIDCIRSFRMESLSERTLSVSVLPAASFINCSMSSMLMLDCGSMYA